GVWHHAYRRIDEGACQRVAGRRRRSHAWCAKPISPATQLRGPAEKARAWRVGEVWMVSPICVYLRASASQILLSWNRRYTQMHADKKQFTCYYSVGFPRGLWGMSFPK